MSKRLKTTDKDALRLWEEMLKSLKESTSIDVNETHGEKIKRIARLEADDEAWFKYYFPLYYKSDPALFHKKATKRIMKNKRWYEVRAWSRELAKTTRTMFENMKLALTGEVRNTLLISNSESNAKRLLLPVKANLEENQRIINDYGTQQKPGSWEDGEFTTKGGASWRAIGAGQSPRGTRNEAWRTDFLWFDDIDTDEETRNPDRIKIKWEWIEQAVIPTLSVSGDYRILFCGNIIAKDCCISRAIKKADFPDIINIRDKNGVSSWAKNSEQDIDRFLSLISTASGQKEFFNNPISEGDIFKEITWGAVPPLEKFPFLVNYSDPAPSNNTKTKANSYKSNFLVGILDFKLYVITGYLDRVTNSDFVDWFYFIDSYVKGKNQVYSFIENNKLQDPFYQQVFKPLFATARDKFKKNVNISPDPRPKPDKYARIEGNLEPLNREGRMIFNIAEKDNPHMQRLEDQFKLITPQLSAPADGADCIEGAYFIFNEKLSSLGQDSIKTFIKQNNSKRI